MAITEYIRRFIRLNNLIEEGYTGSSEEIASNLNISSRQVREYLNAIEELGKPIKYNRKTGNYEYQEGSQWLVVWPKN